MKKLDFYLKNSNYDYKMYYNLFILLYILKKCRKEIYFI